MKAHKLIACFLLFFIAAVLPNSLQARKAAFKKIGKVTIDRSWVKARRFSKAKINKFKNDSSFDYDNKKPPKTIIDRFFAWINSKIREFLFWTYKHKAVHYTIEFILYAAVIFSVVFIILKLLNSDIRGVFSKKSESIRDDNVLLDDITNIHTINLDELIREYLSKKEYRLVVRFYYTKMLKALSSKRLINWKIDKSNRDYFSEIKDQGLKSKFTYITSLFEYAWYGNIDIDPGMYSQMEKHFLQFDKLVEAYEKVS